MSKKKKEEIKQKVKYQLAGWILFIICAMFFTASGLKNHDIWTLLGSVVFLIACIVFIIPLAGANKKKEYDTVQHNNEKNS